MVIMPGFVARPSQTNRTNDQQRPVHVSVRPPKPTEKAGDLPYSAGAVYAVLEGMVVGKAGNSAGAPGTHTPCHAWWLGSLLGTGGTGRQV